MAGLFAGLEKMGLGKITDTKIYEDKDVKKEVPKAQVKKAEEKTEKDILIPKSHKCPICDNAFKTMSVKTGAAKLVSQDSDLRPRYQFDTLKYDAITCPRCGYSSLSKTFDTSLSVVQSRLLKQQVCQNFTGIPEPGEIYSYDDAIVRHQLALACSVIKMAKNSEKAYCCLKLAWLMRGKAETLPADTENIEAVKRELAENEQEFLKNAYEGFMEAFSKEPFPMYGMDEITITYLTAELARRQGKYEDALRSLSRIIQNPNANDRIKEKARNMKDEIAAAK